VLGKPLRWPLGVSPEALAGRLIHGVRRRGKYLLLDLDEGLLLLHLGMSGRCSSRLPCRRRACTTTWTCGPTMGCCACTIRAASAPWCGPRARRWRRRASCWPAWAPSRWTRVRPAVFHAALKRRRAPIKQVLLAGDVVVGVGNIYASEALFMAGIRPTVRADRLSRARPTACMPPCAPCWGGRSSVAAPRCATCQRHGRDGHFQLDVAVYGRAGQPCVVCATPIRLLRQGQRSTFYCPVCQRA
jgi:formamidopyrimidine-DNA glycosylase